MKFPLALARAIGAGVDRALMAAIESWACSASIRRMQLSVLTTNVPAIALYRKDGFFAEDILRDSAIVDRLFVNQYLMAKLLSG